MRGSTVMSTIMSERNSASCAASVAQVVDYMSGTYMYMTIILMGPSFSSLFF